jgi:hypothetical protein
MIIMLGDEFNMNNTKTLAAIAAILIVGTLVVAGTLAATSATSAFAYQKKRGQDDRKNGNTVTAQICKQKGSVSGFDNTAEQECGNTICTHPSAGATCVSENEQAVTPPVTPPVEKECLAAQPATTFDVTTKQSASTHFPSGTIVCLGKPGTNNPQNFPPGAAAIPPGGNAVTGLTLRIDNSDSSGRCPAGGVTATVDSGIPPGGFHIGDTACITGLT